MAENDFNPRAERLRRNGAKFNVLKFEELENPIPAQIADSEDIRRTYKNYPFVPYAGTQPAPQDAFLMLLKLLSKNAPTLGACITSIKRYAFAGDFKVIQYDGEFITKLDSDQSNYFQFINSIDINTDAVRNPLKTYVKSLYDNWKECGNYFLIVKVSDTDGEVSSRIIRKDPEFCRYLATPIDDPKQIAISLNWDYDYLVRHEPEVIPVYPYYTEENGVKSTIIHVKQGNGIWYGRPDWIAAWLAAYSEYQNALYMIKEARNDFRTRAIIETELGSTENFGLFTDEESAQEAGFDSAADRLEHNVTMVGGDPQYLLPIERPYGAQPMKVHEFQSNQTHQKFKATNEINEKFIIRCNEWSQKLIDSMGASGLMGNVFMEDIAAKEMSVLPDVRNDVLSGLNTAFSTIAEWTGQTEFENLGLSIESKFKEIANEFSYANDSRRGRSQQPTEG